MEYRRLGISGMKVSAISIGAWLTYGNSVNYKTAEACLNMAIDSGINFIDCADVYAKGKAEETVGKVIAGKDRTKFVLSTKAYFPMSDDPNDRGLSRKHIIDSVHKSLKRLGTDYLDIFFCHRYDTDTTTEETVRAINDLIKQGKIMYWGTSMWGSGYIDDAVRIADDFNAHKPVVEQPLYNMLDRHVVEGDLEDAVSDHALGLVVWSPLAGGVLTGKYNNGVPDGSRATAFDWMKNNITESRLDIVRELKGVADYLGVDLSALALAWALNHQNVDSVITGASKPEHINNNLKALDINWTPDLENRLEEILKNKPYRSSRTAVNPDDIVAL
jgi:voltage-dependent potassium channel beta subunit